MPQEKVIYIDIVTQLHYCLPFSSLVILLVTSFFSIGAHMHRFILLKQTININHCYSVDSSGCHTKYFVCRFTLLEGELTASAGLGDLNVPQILFVAETVSSNVTERSESSLRSISDHFLLNRKTL